MLDLSHIPSSQQDIQIFYASEGAFAYQTWRKPKKCSFVYVLCIGAGSAGCPGVSSNLNTAASSFYGGSSGSVSRCLINSSFVPDVLYVKVGKGGIGAGNPNIGGGGQFGSNVGESSGIFVLPILSSQSSANERNSFIGGNNQSNFLAGGNASSLGDNFLIGLTNFISTVGKIALVGFSNTPFDQFILSSQIVTEGLAGAPVNSTLDTPFNGGSFAATAVSPRIQGGTGGGLVGGNGDDGYTSWKPFFSTGGAGGGNSYTAGGVAGKGGNGGIGSGGGNGGNANFGTAGAGGNGGDGIVIIISF